MPPRTGLGELEQLMLLAILAHDNRASGLEVSTRLDTRASRKVSKGALYATLERLRSKGLVTASSEPPRNDPDGPARRSYQVTDTGREQLRQAADGFLALWRDALPEITP